MTVLANHGISVRNLAFDTMVAAYLLGEGGGTAGGARLGGGSLSLKWLASKRLGVEMTPITDLIGKAGPKQILMSSVPLDQDLPLRLRRRRHDPPPARASWKKS